MVERYNRLTAEAMVLIEQIKENYKVNIKNTFTEYDCDVFAEIKLTDATHVQNDIKALKRLYDNNEI